MAFDGDNHSPLDNWKLSNPLSAKWERTKTKENLCF